MLRSWIACCLVFAICTPALAQNDAAFLSAAAAVVEEVVVTGEQPGPQLWKATKDGHVLWIFGTVTPKPRGIVWRSKQVANVLDSTQEVIDQQLQATTWPVNFNVRPDTINPFKTRKAARQSAEIRESHTPPPLHEVLPADLYSRFERVRNRYLPNDTTIENQRPRIAANMLFNAAVAAAGLTSRAMIHEEVHRLARKKRIRVSAITLQMKFDLETLATIQREFNETPPAAELECFESTLAQLEKDLPTVTARANAWAIGDLQALRELPLLRREACDRVTFSAPRWSQLDAQMETLWLDTVDKAVAKNRSTLVLLDMAELLAPDGLVAALVTRGYQVEEP